MENLKQIEKNKEIPDVEAELEVVFNLKPIRHGLRATAMMARGENRRDFNDLCNSLDLEWSPRTPTEQFYVEQMAVSQWKLQRMQIVEYDNFFDQTPSAPGQIPLLERLMQCQVRMERSYAQAQLNLQRLQKTRPRPAPALRYEQTVFTPDPPRDAEDLPPGPGAELIDISTRAASTGPEDDQSPVADQPPALSCPPSTPDPPPDAEDLQRPESPTAHRPPPTGPLP